MNSFSITVDREKILIEKEAFLSLLDFPPIKNRVSYKEAIKNNRISLKELKILASISLVPYPLFFAPLKHVVAQIENQNKELFSKLPGKEEISVSSRGKMRSDDILLIVKDLARKQEFLKKRLIKNSINNEYVGSIAVLLKKNLSIESIAEWIREYFDIDLDQMRKGNKNSALAYLLGRLEAKAILVSRSSHDYMPQNIDKNVFLSGICIKDRKFPFIFINTRDGDENPIILETDGRQIFTLILMLVNIGMNKFLLSVDTVGVELSESTGTTAFSIAGEILIPNSDINGVVIKNLNDLEVWSGKFSVTPSMLLTQLQRKKKISYKLAGAYRLLLREKLNKKERSFKSQPKSINAYEKYNGTRFSKEVMRGYSEGLITRVEATGVLFKKRKITKSIFQECQSRYTK